MTKTTGGETKSILGLTQITKSIFQNLEIKNNNPSHLSGVRVATSALIGRRILF